MHVSAQITNVALFEYFLAHLYNKCNCFGKGLFLLIIPISTHAQIFLINSENDQ